MKMNNTTKVIPTETLKTTKRECPLVNVIHYFFYYLFILYF